MMLSLSNSSFGQTKKTMTPDDYQVWNRIGNKQISDNGNIVCYTLTRERKDPEIVLHKIDVKTNVTFERASKPTLTPDGTTLVFTKSPSVDTIRAMKRRKVKTDDLPKDTLVVYNIQKNTLKFFPDASDLKISDENPYFFAFKSQLPNYKKDTTLLKNEIKKQSKENGSNLIVYHITKEKMDTVKYVTSYGMASKAPVIAYASTGKDTTNKDAIYVRNFSNDVTFKVFEKDITESKFYLKDDAESIGVLIHSDTTKAKIKPWELVLWSNGSNDAKVVINAGDAKMPKNYMLSEYYATRFEEGGSGMYFGLSQIPLQEDTTLLDDEKAIVEVWNYQDVDLYTMQETTVDQDLKKSYMCRYDMQSNTWMQLATEEMDRVVTNPKNKGNNALGISDNQYRKTISWEGRADVDGYLLDLRSGQKSLIEKAMSNSPRLSPSTNLAYWFDDKTQSYKLYNVATKTKSEVLTRKETILSDELNDVPADPNPYGVAGFTTDEKAMLVYDRYDIWVVDLSSGKKGLPYKLTDGRKRRMVYRIIKIDSKEDYFNEKKPFFIEIFDEVTKEAGYASLDFETKKMNVLVKGPFKYSGSLMKAKDADVYLTSKEDFKTFPDILVTNAAMNIFEKISNANPQQSEYFWGSSEIMSWRNKSGELLQGIIVKPDNFNPKKKYPLLINFYERSSDDVHSYRTPLAGRSSINYSYYANKGYVIFNPDITYKIGYPGESCYEDLISGVDALLKKGFVDSTNMGLQGHSWGGYQVAYMIGKTNRFKCAESGAPVVNMVSAYGGIRWGTGMSRMFQYEKTQSRIGATLWKSPQLYLSNSPIFDIDKVKTPVLIMHNDEDSAVPWYQGIEYFTALRRLNKPSWLLNYNGEPHWPTKWPNILDFNIRMEQFFDHYLMDKPIPVWMKSGIPVVQKGKVDGYELLNK